MSDVGAITSQVLSQSQTDLSLQVQTFVLKKDMDLQKETAQMILEALGVGRNLDVQA
jgi:hypothetical protein